MSLLMKATLFLLSFCMFIEVFHYYSLLVPAMAFIVIGGKLRFHSYGWPVWIALSLYAIASLVSIVNALDVDSALLYFRFSVYLYIFTFLISAIVGTYGYEPIEVLFDGAATLTIIAAIASFAGFFGFLPIADMVIYNGERMAGFSVNPNYFGTSLDMIIMYLYYKIGVANKMQKIRCMIGITILMPAILLAYSRAAWVALIISVVSYSLLIAIQTRSKTAMLKFGTSLAGFIIFAGIAWVAAYSLGYTESIENRFKLEDYDTDRFLVHDLLREKVSEHPLGLGPGQSGVYLSSFYNNIEGSQASESSYITALFESGYMGLALYLLFLACLFFLSLRISLNSWQYSKVSALITSIYYGMLLWSTVASALQLKSFWLICGIICGLNILYSRRNLCAEKPLP